MLLETGCIMTFPKRHGKRAHRPRRWPDGEQELGRQFMFGLVEIWSWVRIVESIVRCLVFVGGGSRVVVSTAAFHARVRGSVPGLGGLKEAKMFLPHPRVKVSIVGSLRDREVACSASDRQGSNFESSVRRTVSSQSSHHPQEVLLAHFSLYMHKGGPKPDSFPFLPRVCWTSVTLFCEHVVGPYVGVSLVTGFSSASMSHLPLLVRWWSVVCDAGPASNMSLVCWCTM